jgi:hypothetical protein
MCRSPKDHQQLHVGEQHVAPQLAQALTSSPQPDITYSPAKEVQKSAAFFSLWARRMYGHSTAAPQARNRSLNSPLSFLPLPFRLSTVDCQPLLFIFISLLHRFNLTAEVCSNDPTVLHPFSVFSNLCETSYPHPRTGHTQNLTFRPTAKSPI